MAAHLLPPSLIMILGGIMLAVLPFQLRKGVMLCLPVLALYAVWQLDSGDTLNFQFMAYQLTPVKVHPFSHIFATAFVLAAWGGSFFFINKNAPVEVATAFTYAGAALGVVFAGDLLSFFIFWELMAVASTTLIWLGGTPQARLAGLRYVYMHILSGILLLVGIAAQVYITGTTAMPTFTLHMPDTIWTSSLFLDSEVYTDFLSNLYVQSIGIWCILAGVLINVATPPFSAWLPDAYPEASPEGSIFLSAFTTKTSIFVLLSYFSGTEFFIWIGLFMAGYGVVMACLEKSIRRLLSYAIINQLGFMLVAIGVGTPLAEQGAAVQAFAHILYKTLLFMTAAAVIYGTGKFYLGDLGGVAKTQKVTTICAIIGVLSMGLPWTAGYVAKSMIASAVEYQQLHVVWFLLMAASGAVFFLAGGRYLWFTFFNHAHAETVENAPMNMRIAMMVFAFLCLFVGILPQQTVFALLPETTSYDAYTLSHIIHQCEMLLWGGVGLFICLPFMRIHNTITLDFDWFYRRLFSGFANLLEKVVFGVYTAIITALQHVVQTVLERIAHLTGPGGPFAETKTVANATLIMAALLAGYLLLYYYT